MCELDPKPLAGHVCVRITGANDEELKAGGTVHSRKNGRSWVDIADIQGAEAVEPFVGRAYREAGSGTRRRVRNQ